jgi:hypothetical protein
MVAHGDGRRVRMWRSRAFVEPLLLTIAGAFASYAVALAFFWGEPCTASESACGYGIVGRTIGILSIFALGMSITGFVVGRSSSDFRFAVAAVLLAVAMVSLMTIVAILILGGQRDYKGSEGPVVYVVGSFGVVVVALLAPMAVGFGLGRLWKKRPAGESNGPPTGSS